jgi:DNA-binding MarR family transcriptional regulator
MSLQAADTESELKGEDRLVDAVLGASRALVAVAARSLASLAEDVTLPQYRVLVELAARGPQRVLDLAVVLAVDASTASRMCERLVRKGLVYRRRLSTDRRSVRVSLTPAGRQLVEEVTRRRRDEIARILSRLPRANRRPVLSALRAFADAAGEVPEQDWTLGWDLSP